MQLDIVVDPNDNVKVAKGQLVHEEAPRELEY